MDDPCLNDQTGSLAATRSRRSRPQKTNRLAALERLKKAKSGQKDNYEVAEVNAVYDIVNEEEYSKKVRKRLEEDWIVDDAGLGYVEDGREIFDDDLTEQPTAPATSKSQQKKQSHSSKAKVEPSAKKPSVSSNIKNMFLASHKTAKKKAEKEASLANDEALEEILGDLMNSTPSQPPLPKPVIKRKRIPGVTPGSSKNVFSQRTPKRLIPSSTVEPRTFHYQTSPPTLPATKPPKQPTKLPKHKSSSPSFAKLVPPPPDTPEIDDDTPPPAEEPDIQDDYGMDVDMAEMDDWDENNAMEVEEPKKEEPKPPPSGPVIPAKIGWEEVCNGTDQKEEEIFDFVVDSSKLPLTTNENGDQVLRFYWLDAYEDYFKQPGIVYLFGKVWVESVNRYVSCSVAVKNIEKRIYFLPREKKVNTNGDETDHEVTMKDVYEEFSEIISAKYKIMKFKSMKTTRQYCFEIDGVPVESDYLEVRYAADLPRLPQDLKGETFSHVFGTNTSSIELLLLHREIKGPCWLDLKLPQMTSKPVSWCKVEAFVNRPDFVIVLKEQPSPPPLVVMTLNLQTLLNPKSHQNEVMAFAALVHHKFHIDKTPPQPPFQQYFCAVTRPADCIFPLNFNEVAKNKHGKNVDIIGTERGLLGCLLAKIHKIDPDVLVGHDIYGFDLDVLMHRINTLKVPFWSKIGRLKRQVMPKLSTGGWGVDKSLACGRLICDVKISAKELIRCKSYDLTELSSQILKHQRQLIPFEDVRKMFDNAQYLMSFIEHALMDASLALRIMCELNILPLALQITTICGNIMSRTLMGGRSERNEYLLLHAFHQRKFIVPDKTYGKKPVVEEELNDNGDEDYQKGGGKANRKARRKPAYTGGLVLDPKIGFYDRFILLLDFNSLYPSIIQEYNICFTTISRTPENLDKAEGADGEDLLPELPEPGLELGILPTEIRKLVQRRRQVKQLMKEPNLSSDLRVQYDIRQKALKLTANSMYGCLGFTFSRFYAKPLAALVTSKGREILMKTKDLVQKMNLDVVYGDTDSIMINTNSTDLEEVYKLGNKVKNEVNKLYRLLEIDIDGVFQSMLLLKKKKYAALSIQKLPDGSYTAVQELKGLDIVRRDWCDLAKEAGKYVIGQILSAESREIILENIHTKLAEIGEKVNDNEIPIKMFEINKALTKNPQDYPEKKSLPHVHVALWLNSHKGKKVGAGDTISYVICEDGSSLPATQRAYHPDEVGKKSNLKIDTKYYLAHQVHPVVSRLCDPIDGTDAAHIAACLGLDPSGYRHSIQQHQDAESDALLGKAQLSDEEKYKDCDRFTFNCANQACKKEIIIDEVFSGSGKEIRCRLSYCPNPECEAKPADNVSTLCNKLILFIRECVQKYYSGWLVCEDTSCAASTRRVPLNPHRGQLYCQVCHKASVLRPLYSEKKLYDQLSFLQCIFDLKKAYNHLTDIDKSHAKAFTKNYQEVYGQLKHVVDNWMDHNGYNEINLAQIFQSKIG